MKECTKCKIAKELTEFRKKSRNKDGRKGQCIVCSKIVDALYRNNNRQKIRAAQSKYEQDNKHIRATYKENNKDRLREHARLYALENKDKIKEYLRNNKDKTRNSKAIRRARLRGQTPDMTPLEKQMIEGLYFISIALSNSCGEDFHIDHIYPISKGGLHCFKNLQILSAEENLRKGASIES